MDYLTTHTSLSPIQRGFVSGFVNYKKGCTQLPAASDKVYQLFGHGRWFSLGTSASSTTKTDRHEVEILLKVALNTINQIKQHIAITRMHTSNLQYMYMYYYKGESNGDLSCDNYQCNTINAMCLLFNYKIKVYHTHTTLVTCKQCFWLDMIRMFYLKLPWLPLFLLFLLWKVDNTVYIYLTKYHPLTREIYEIWLIFSYFQGTAMWVTKACVTTLHIIINITIMSHVQGMVNYSHFEGKWTSTTQIWPPWLGIKHGC